MKRYFCMLNDSWLVTNTVWSIFLKITFFVVILLSACNWNTAAVPQSAVFMFSYSIYAWLRNFFSFCGINLLLLFFFHSFIILLPVWRLLCCLWRMQRITWGRRAYPSRAITDCRLCSAVIQTLTSNIVVRQVTISNIGWLGWQLMQWTCSY
jgi:hypothetical protein